MRIRTPQNTREKILRTAFEEFYRNGFQSGSLNRIIEDAGVTKGALFHHYDGKQALGFAVIEEIISGRIAERWSKPLAKSVDPVADIQQIVKNIMKQNVEGNGLDHGCPLNNLAQEMSPLDEGFRLRIEKIYDAWRDGIEAALERGVKTGHVRKSIAPRQVAAFVVAAMTGIIGTAKNAQSEDLMRAAGAVLIDYLEGLKP
jgi:TetR/AcrR family transcriptional repressor of nem operon